MVWEITCRKANLSVPRVWGGVSPLYPEYLNQLAPSRSENARRRRFDCATTLTLREAFFHAGSKLAMAADRVLKVPAFSVSPARKTCQPSCLPDNVRQPSRTQTNAISTPSTKTQ